MEFVQSHIPVAFAVLKNVSLCALVLCIAYFSVRNTLTHCWMGL